MTIISLVSDQPMPNLLFIRQMPEADRYVFLTTERMEAEGKTDNLVRVCGIPPGKVDYIYTDHENLDLIVAAWKELEDDTDDDYHINLTGGTKMMALATYAFFTQSLSKDRVKVYYLPLNAGLIRQTFPVSQEILLDANVEMEAYLEVHGVKLISHEPWIPWASKAREVFRHVSRQHTNYRIQNLLLESRTNPEDLGIESLSAEERSFYSGKWLEVWLASQVRDLLGVPQHRIFVGAKVNKSGEAVHMANEYDLLFIKDRRLYLGECKYFSSLREKKMRDISKELFKMGGANNLTGLNARPFLAIYGGFSSLDTPLREQCRILRLPPPALLDTLTNQEKLTQYLLSI
jgi:hypothetical protein